MTAMGDTTAEDTTDGAALGREARKQTPRRSHGDWKPAADRLDPVALLGEQDATREPSLVPIRHGRMGVSAFSFYRGAAAIMAADLAGSPSTGITVQLCGDAHLMNFGLYRSPDRRLVFDVNDFDETLPGPWEWDVKRLAASVIVAARDRGFSSDEGRAAAGACARRYREAMAVFAGEGSLDVWYERLDVDRLLVQIDEVDRGIYAKRAQRVVAKAQGRGSEQALEKLATLTDAGYRIVSDPPGVVRLEELAEELDAATIGKAVDVVFQSYRESVSDELHVLLDRYEVADTARKIVGVGSVGTRCYIGLLLGREHGDPLFLQLKEASASVLERWLPASEYRHHGRRVVEGQRLMQAASDIFLGWSDALVEDRHYYWRQLRDGKGSVDPARMTPRSLVFYATTCAWTLARAHARSGSPIAIAAYLGKGAVFDDAITEFACRYADQNHLDYEAHRQAIADGRVEARTGI